MVNAKKDVQFTSTAQLLVSSLHIIIVTFMPMTANLYYNSMRKCHNPNDCKNCTIWSVVIF